MRQVLVSGGAGFVRSDFVRYLPEAKPEAEVTNLGALTEGLLLTVQWYGSHPDWIASISNQQDPECWMDQNYGKREAQA